MTNNHISKIPTNSTATRFASIQVDTSSFEKVFNDINEKLSVNAQAVQEIDIIRVSIHELRLTYATLSENLIHTNKRLDDLAEQLAKINQENDLWGTVNKSVAVQPLMGATEVAERRREKLLEEKRQQSEEPKVNKKLKRP